MSLVYGVYRVYRRAMEATPAAGAVLERFSEFLGFQFQDSSDERTGERATGMAPSGKLGVLDVADGPAIEVSFLFNPASLEVRDQVWVDCCLIALADSLDVDFLPWLRKVRACHEHKATWTARRRFGAYQVALWFHPIDIMLLTVQERR